MKVSLRFAVASLVMLAASHHASAGPINLITNSSFESYGNGVFTGWTSSGNTGNTPGQYAVQQPTDGSTAGMYGDVVSPDPFTFSPTPAGSHAAYFVADQADVKLSQSLQLTVGQTYTTGFDLYMNPSGAGNPGGFSLSEQLGAANSPATLKTVSNSELNPGVWTHFSTSFVATSANQTFALEFISGGWPAADVLVDGVYVSPVSEPASLAIFGLALLGLWGMRRATIG